MRGGLSRHLAAVIATTMVGPVACSTAGAPAVPSPHSSPAPSVVQLRINVANPPERWPTVSSFTYGKRPDELGSADGSAVAVVGNSLWVVDPSKRRVAHYTLEGSYLGQLAGVSSPVTALHVDHHLRWSVEGATLDVRMARVWHRRYSLVTEHVVAVQVRSVQTVLGHVYLCLGVAGAPTTASGGALLLELDGQGNVASLERVATPAGDGPQSPRPFYVASAGRVYQWFTTRTHAELRRRP